MGKGSTPSQPLAGCLELRGTHACRFRNFLNLCNIRVPLLRSRRLHPARGNPLTNGTLQRCRRLFRFYASEKSVNASVNYERQQLLADTPFADAPYSVCRCAILHLQLSSGQEEDRKRKKLAKGVNQIALERRLPPVKGKRAEAEPQEDIDLCNWNLGSQIYLLARIAGTHQRRHR